jgi:NAD(P)-dependent dehydrogenase (short-subunit alcohol dehydrogenase family)
LNLPAQRPKMLRVGAAGSIGGLNGLVAVVTGGNRGIGRAIALAMAAAGASVAVAARNEESLRGVGAEIEAAGSEALTVRCDVSLPASVDAMADAVLARFGGADVVVANAGIAGPTKPLHAITPEEWRECIATDLDGVYLTFRRFVPGMIERRRGSLIAISSITGKRPLGQRTPYAAAKMGVIGLVRTLAMELGPYGVRVNSVCPGAVEGPRIEDVIRAQAHTRGISEVEARSQFTEPAALKRLVLAEEVAAACVFLASDAAAAITGEDLNISAGLVMY